MRDIASGGNILSSDTSTRRRALWTARKQQHRRLRRVDGIVLPRHAHLEHARESSRYLLFPAILQRA